jgi:hypothetical protein
MKRNEKRKQATGSFAPKARKTTDDDDEEDGDMTLNTYSAR